MNGEAWANASSGVSPERLSTNRSATDRVAAVDSSLIAILLHFVLRQQGCDATTAKATRREPDWVQFLSKLHILPRLIGSKTCRTSDRQTCAQRGATSRVFTQANEN